jgi:SAM-dependent methyltransferase
MTGIDFKRLLRGDVRVYDRGPRAYVVSAFVHYGVRALLLPRINRDASAVMQEYNHERQEYWKSELSPDEYVWGDSATERWILLDNRLVRGTYRDVRRRLLPLLKARVSASSNPGDLIVEYGAGTGRNLAYLARELPDRRYLGLELTPRSVEDARAMLAKAGVNVEMRVADITSSLVPKPDAAVAYSMNALEQLPGDRSRHALASMAEVARRAVVCLEPIRELFPRSLRGLTARLRQYRADYLVGLPRHARALGLHVETEAPLGLAENPLNELCELRVVR